MKNLKALNDRVFIKPVEPEKITAGGIFIPDSVAEESTTGLVVAVGPGTYTNNGTLIPLEVKSSDIVIFAKHSGIKVDFNGEDLLVLRSYDIFAVVENLD